MCDYRKPDESAEPTVIVSIYTDHQRWIMRSDGSSQLIGSTKTVTPGYKTGMKVKPNIPVKNYGSDYNDLSAVYWLQYKNFFGSPFPIEHRFLCRQYSRQRSAIATLTRQINELRADIKELRTNEIAVNVNQTDSQLVPMGLAFLIVFVFTILMMWVTDSISRHDRLRAYESRRPTTPRPPEAPLPR